MKKIIIAFFLLLILTFIYGYYVDTNGFIIKENTIVVDNISDSYNGFKIIQFSDTLINSEQDIKNLNNVVSSINNLEPDIVFFTGDLLNSSYKLKETETVSNILNRINAKYGKYAIIGDNDQNNLNDYKLIMDDSSFELLDNKSSLVFYKDINPIQIIGVTTPSGVNTAMVIDEDINPIYKIILTHYPDNIDSFSDIDLVLAGHSLLGQVRLPFFGGIIKKTGATKYIDDYYEINDTKMYVTGGLGTEKTHFRLLNKPQINLYRLKK